MFSVFRRVLPRRAAGAFLLGAAVLWLAGCAAMKPKTPEEIVIQRSQERWAAMIGNDFDLAWTYTQPGYRAIVQQRDYRKRFGGAGQWKAAKVIEARCEAEKCTVYISLTTQVLVPPFTGNQVTGRIEEVWVREDDQWWCYQAL